MNAPEIKPPAIEQFLPPPPDKVVGFLGEIVGNVVKGVGGLLAAPARLIEQVGEDVRRIPK